MNYIPWIIIGLALLLSGCSTKIENLTIEQVGDEGISVQGTAEAKVLPDQAELTLGVETRAETAEDAERINAQASDAVIDALIKAGVRKADIQTSYYYLQPQVDYREYGAAEVLGYIATHTLLIETENLDNVGALIDAAVNAGANQVQGVQFTLSEQAQAQAYRDILGEATKDAQAKADAIAQALGVAITGVKTASTDYAFMPKFAMAEAAFDGAASRAEILPGEVDVSATITVVYDIA